MSSHRLPPYTRSHLHKILGIIIIIAAGIAPLYNTHAVNYDVLIIYSQHASAINQQHRNIIITHPESNYLFDLILKLVETY